MNIIYSDYDIEDYIDKAREELLDFEGIKNPTDQELREYTQHIMEDDWDCLVNKVMLRTNRKYIAYGVIGRWDGSHRGWTVLENDDDFYKLIEDCGFVEIQEEDDGLLRIKCSHHDGTNFYELKVLTDEGWQYYDDHCLEADWKELGNTLITDERYSRNPCIEWSY